jgi:hypothetical protein
MMACYDELTLSIAVDGELPEDEQTQLSAHLDACPTCSRLCATLEIEVASLRGALSATVAPPDQPGLSWTFWLFGFAAACVGTALTLAGLDPSALPAPLAWLHPLGTHLALGLMSRLALYLVEEGVPTMLPNVAVIASLALLGLAFSRRALKPAALAAGVIVALATPAQATVHRFPEKGSQMVVIGPAETIDDTVVATADTVVVEGVIKGDLIALAREVRVKGRVTGSLAALARHLELDGQVDGDVYALHETLTVRGQVGRNIHVAAKRLVFDSSASVAHDLRAAADEARVSGAVGRRLTVYAKSTELAGKVGGSALLQCEHAAVRDSAQVGGDLTINVPKKANADVAAAATVTGAREVREDAVKESGKTRGPKHEISRLRQPRFYLWQLLWLVAALVTGALLYWIAPGAFDPRASSALATLKSMGLGFIVLVVTPIAAILAAITAIGLPTGLITLAAYFAALYLAGVFTSAWLGRLIIKRPALDLRTLLLSLLVGQLVLRFATPLPFVGGFVCFLALVLGLGLAAAAVAASVRRLRSA